MDADPLAQMSKKSVTVVRGFRDRELRVPLEGEKPRKIGAKRTVRTPEATMRVLPLPLVRGAIGPFPEEFTIEHIPDIESCLTLHPIHAREAQRNASESPRRVCLRVGGDVTLQGCDLMELTDLDGDAASDEHLPHSFAPVDDRYPDDPSKCANRIDAGCVVFHPFCRDFPPVQILLNRATEQNTLAPLKIHRIKDRHDLFLHNLHFTACAGICIEEPPECFGMDVMLRRQIGKGVPAVRVQIVGLCDPSRRSVTGTLKDRAAISAPISLMSVAPTVL